MGEIMGKFVLALVCLFALNANAAFKGSPFPKEIDKRFDAIERPEVNQRNPGLWNFQIARAEYSVALVGGTSSATAKSLSVTIPKNAIVWSGALYVDTAFSAASGGTVSVLCGDATLLQAQGLTSWSAGDIKALSVVGTAATALKVGTSDCAVSVKNGTANSVSGKLTVWLMYFLYDNP